MTKDEISIKALLNLQKINGGINAANFSKIDPTLVDERISFVYLHKRKTSYIIEAAKRCHSAYEDDIPRSYEELLNLKGVGVKMATLIMSYAWKEEIGIGVDVHIHHVSNLLGWVSTKSPNETEKALQEKFPKEYWNDLNESLQYFGKNICTKRKPKCSQCPIQSSCSMYIHSKINEDEK